ncbi:tripartite tricarboxylate transporter substrate binding protein [Aliiroseovarius subalbicans]|uniref:Bug family tripartite tricarboxylate transporter substrate binding protein n=1 Tax=Aliiroseovarius subalbicans TaxID=2925840 RepID=UPI001F579BF1|nr:tripartite tricarboxylate transporter substrate binding protein [Aliiroseovarius subalbicans]MCI2400971.1 tripartite tricarboxylate transporter substrate binding protein [Aliiroseovarius subalbicans]
MKFIRSSIVALAAAAGLASTALAAEFPAKPVTIIVPFSAGGGTDITTRTLAGPMAEALGVEIVVKNTAGAGGTIGAAETARSKPNGYTIGMMPVGPMTTQPHLRELPYNPESFDYICQAYSAPSSLVVRKDSPFNSLQDMLEHAKANPGTLNYGVQAVGSIPHVAGLGLAAASGAEFTFIPYKGSAPTFKAMLDGSVDMFVAHISFLTKNSDQVKSLAMLTSERVSTAQDLPTATDQGVPMHFPIWGGLVAPKGIPAEAKAALEAACEAGMNSEAFSSRMADLRMPLAFMGSADFEAFVNAEFSKNDKLLTAAGLKK